MKTLVIGGTGTVGSEVVSGLMKRQAGVRVMTHSINGARRVPRGVEGYRADLDDPGSLAPAFEGIDRVFFLAPVGPGETYEGLNAVNAAKKAGVQKIVYMSVSMPEGSSDIPHFRSKIPVENAVKSSGIAYTILRPNNFFQNDQYAKDAIIQAGVYPFPIGGTGVNRVDVRDVADGAVNALLNPAFDGEIFDVHGPDTLTGDAVAAIYGRHFGRAIRYGGDDLDAWAKASANMMPEYLIADMRIMYRYFQDRGMIAAKEDLEKLGTLLGHRPRSFENYVKELVQIWKATSGRAA